MQRISSPRALKELTVSVNCYAHAKSLGGHVDLQIAPRDGAVRWKTSTDKTPGGVHNGPLLLKIPGDQLRDLRTLDVHVILRSTSGVEGGNRQCASLNSLSIRAK